MTVYHLPLGYKLYGAKYTVNYRLMYCVMLLLALCQHFLVQPDAYGLLDDDVRSTLLLLMIGCVLLIAFHESVHFVSLWWSGEHPYVRFSYHSILLFGPAVRSRRGLITKQRYAVHALLPQVLTIACFVASYLCNGLLSYLLADYGWFLLIASVPDIYNSYCALRLPRGALFSPTRRIFVLCNEAVIKT